jgi:hypothetical protein
MCDIIVPVLKPLWEKPFMLSLYSIQYIRIFPSHIQSGRISPQHEPPGGAPLGVPACVGGGAGAR